MVTLNRSLTNNSFPETPPAVSKLPLADRINYHILPATEVSPSKLEEFYEKTYPARAGFLRGNWRWLYRLGEFDWAAPPVIAVSKEQVIGHLGNIPVLLRQGEEERRAAWLVDLAVLPGLQRQGVGIALVKSAMAQWPILLGFGNERSMGVLLKCGWELKQHTLSFQLLLRPEQHPKFQRSAYGGLMKVAGLATRVTWQARALLQKEISVEPITPDGLAEFTGQSLRNSLHVARSASFLSWRIAAHPWSTEHVILRQQNGGEAKCKAIARIRDENGFRRLHLLSLAAPSEDRSALSEFLAGVARWAAREDFHRVLLVTSDPAIAAVARWWLPISTTLRFIYHANDDAGWEYLRSPDHSWECIDNDFDLT